MQKSSQTVYRLNYVPWLYCHTHQHRITAKAFQLCSKSKHPTLSAQGER